MGRKYTITYGDQSKEYIDVNSPANQWEVEYTGVRYETGRTSGEKIHELSCNGKVMRGNIAVGYTDSHTAMECGEKIMLHDVTIKSVGVSKKHVYEKWTMVQNATWSSRRMSTGKYAAVFATKGGVIISKSGKFHWVSADISECKGATVQIRTNYWQSNSDVVKLSDKGSVPTSDGDYICIFTAVSLLWTDGIVYRMQDGGEVLLDEASYGTDTELGYYNANEDAWFVYKGERTV